MPTISFTKNEIQAGKAVVFRLTEDLKIRVYKITSENEYNYFSDESTLLDLESNEPLVYCKQFNNVSISKESVYTGYFISPLDAIASGFIATKAYKSKMVKECNANMRKLTKLGTKCPRNISKFIGNNKVVDNRKEIHSIIFGG